MTAGNRQSMWVVLAVLVTAAVGVLLGVERWSRPQLDHGDLTTDANILNAAKTFEMQGFCETWGLPTLDWRGEDAGREATVSGGGAMLSQPDLYSTYPPGAYWWHLVLRGCGLHEVRHFRVASVVVSCIGALLLFWLARLWTHSGAVALASMCFYLVSQAFIEFADSLHYLSLSPPLLFAALVAWTAHERRVTGAGDAVRPVMLPGESALQAMDAALPVARWKPSWLLVAAMGLYFLNCWVTFEHTLLVGVVVGVRSLWQPRTGRMLRRLLISCLWMGLVPFVVMAMRLTQNAIALGSFERATAVFSSKLEQRASIDLTSGATPDGGVTWHALLHAWVDRLGGLGRHVSPASLDGEFRHPILLLQIVIPCAVLMVMLASTAHVPALRAARRGALAGVLLFAGALTWWLAMREHALVHRYLMLVLLPGLSVLLGSLVTAGYSQWVAHRGTHADGEERGALVPVRFFGPLAATVLIVSYVITLRGSFTLNRHAVLHPEVQRALAARDASETSIGMGAPMFANVTRLVMFQHDAHLAYKLGCPFDNPPHAEGEALGETEARLVQTFSGMGVTEVVRGDVWDRLSADDPRFFVMPRSEFATPAARGLTAEGVEVLVNVVSAWPTLDGRSLLVQATLTAAGGGEHVANFGDLVMAARLIGPDRDGDPSTKRVVDRASATVAERLSIDGARAHVWVSFPIKLAQEAAMIEVTFRPARRENPLVFAEDGATMDEGYRWSADRGAVLIDAAAALRHRGPKQPAQASSGAEGTR